jgi:DNA-binding MarR family transcriptional regulator
VATKQELAALQQARRHGLGGLLLLARQDFLERLGRKLHGSGSGPFLSRARLLPYIDVEGTRSTELARRMGVTKQAVARMVRELEDGGLLAREPDPDDRRAFRVVFTAAGLRYLVRMQRAIGQIERDYEVLHGAERMRVMRETLGAMAYADRPLRQR